MFQSKYFKLGVTIILALVIANLTTFTLFTSSLGPNNDYKEMQRKQMEHSAKMQELARKRVEQQITLQSQQAQQGIEKYQSSLNTQQTWQKSQWEKSEWQRQQERQNSSSYYKDKKAERLQKSQLEKRKEEEQRRARKNEYTAKSSRQKTNTQTCQYWQKRYKETKSEYSKTYRDSACRRSYSD